MPDSGCWLSNVKPNEKNMKKQYRILIVDDDDATREILGDLLEIEGYLVSNVSDGITGLELHREKPFDLVITDIIMPNKEGLETIRELRDIYPQVKIIAISGGGRIAPQNYLVMAEKLGADITFDKPINKEKIIDAVWQLLP